MRQDFKGLKSAEFGDDGDVQVQVLREEKSEVESRPWAESSTAGPPSSGSRRAGGVMQSRLLM